jgi:predicted metal-dependent peptidase
MKLEKLISVLRLRLRIKSPFFATLAMFTEFKKSESIPTAATDGKCIWINPEFLLSLSSLQQDGLILHELLHAALLHSIRRRQREEKLWNIAADIVVNSIILKEDKFELPPKGILPPQNWQALGFNQPPDWDKLSVEEVYELLRKADDSMINSFSWSEDLADLLPPNYGEGKQEGKAENQDKEGNSDRGDKGGKKNSKDSESNENKRDNQYGEINQHQEEKLRAHWKNALQQAVVVARTTSQGKLPAGLQRQIDKVTNPQLDWRSYLWRYLVHTPNDFKGFDRRFVGSGLYLDNLEGESVQVFVAVDTSGSIDYGQLTMFLGEISGILASYPHLQCELYYADADIYGPLELNNPDQIIPKPQGGGGTSFVPFFKKIEAKLELDFQVEGVCVYLTDGYGDFPEKAPELPVLWVVTVGGLDLEQFPFGETIRLC